VSPLQRAGAGVDRAGADTLAAESAGIVVDPTRRRSIRSSAGLDSISHRPLAPRPDRAVSIAATSAHDGPVVLGLRLRRRSGRRRGRRDSRHGRRRRGVPAGRRRRDRARLRGGQEQQRVDVALCVCGLPDAQVDVRGRQLRLAARVDRTHGVAFVHRNPAPDRIRAEMHERDRVSVERLDRHRLAAHRHGSGIRDRAGRRSDNRGPDGRADVDSAMLPGSVGVHAVERECRQHRPGHGPAPTQR
jgi:hypothetical protein